MDQTQIDPATLTPQEKLLRAIELAQEPGGCKYVRDGAPCCVIAQLAFMEGVTIEEMEAWDRGGSTPEHSANIREVLRNNLPGTEKLSHYEKLFLYSVQCEWDDTSISYLDDMRRNYMRERVHSHYGTKP